MSVGDAMASRKPSGKNESSDWMARVRESSHDVVLAGLASLTRAYGADRKRAPADFKTLVTEGRKLEPQLHDTARKVWNEWSEKPKKIMDLRHEGKLRGVLDERVASVLARLGVPTAEEMAELRAKVDQLLEREKQATGSRAQGTKRSKEGARTAAVRASRRAVRRKGARGGREDATE